MEEFFTEGIPDFLAGRQDPRLYSPLVLAFIGDGVYDLVVRTRCLEGGNRPVNELHKQAREQVKAAAQAERMALWEPHLTEEERAVYKRGRNAKSATVPKNARLMDYKNATGFEALLGYLYLKGSYARVLELASQSPPPGEGVSGHD
ncbi:ribonuclease III [Clostridiales bacterium F-3ap]|uniref:Mini-ribonuclease 3 n=1 Tax=Anaerotalea alkaliphila TaxID=2662126 RepID=A0A7X5KMQ1_9FIRM|nr:ribonuclease III domain-containing protein [Anaerotalea alkaliphila]NDL68206.1 ribonuclease III [Anaerotalea alkaliphila]